MPLSFKKIPSIDADNLDYIHPYNQIGHFAKITDPATSVVLDLSHVNLITIRPEATIKEALLEMKFSHSYVLLVVDKSDKVVGVISSEDIMGAKPLKFAMENKIRHSEIKIESIMTPQNTVLIFDLDDLKLAKVGNIIKSMHEYKQPVAEVISFDSILDTYSICGLISLAMISKQLGFDVEAHITKPYTIIELQKWLL